LQGYSQQIAELTKLTRKRYPYIWTEEHARAFQWVKDALTNASVVTHADFSKPFTLWTAASLDGVGAFLQQDNKPIAYESARCSLAERNYTIGEQELLAMIHALKKWRVYLEGGPHPVRLRTDHQPLTYLPTKGVLGSRQVRWSEYLARFNLEWEYIPGQKNIADALSRLPCLHLYVTTRSRTQRVADVDVRPSGEASAGSPIRWKRKREAERGPSNEEPVVASRRNRFGQTDVAGESEGTQVPDGTVEQGRQPSVTQNNEDESLEDKQEVNEASFLDRIRQASKRDAILTQKGLRKRPIERDGLWWKTTEGEHMALYIPKDVGSALSLECIEWVHVHPFSGHVGRDRTT